MAHHKQALKRHRQSIEARTRNRSYRTMAKTAVKKALEVAEQGHAPAVASAFRDAESTVRHAASKGAFPKRRASRKVSRLAKKLAAPSQSA